MKKYRFFYHYNKIKKCMTVHFRGQCILATNKLICEAVTESKKNKRQPYLVMQGFAKDVLSNRNGTVVIV
jgi:hypothetical protein